MKAIQYGELVLTKSPASVTTTRKLWPDNARIIAGLTGPIFHLSSSTLNHMGTIGTTSWWAANYYDAMTPWSIMVFVMISGLFLLNPDKEESALDFYKKRASRVLVPLIFWTLFYLIWTYFKANIVDAEQLSVRYLAKLVVMGRPYYHMWFLYMIVGLYLFTPFFRKIIKHSSDKELLFLCVAAFAFAMTGYAVNCYFRAPALSAFFSFIYFVPYFLAGYLIGRTTLNPHPAILVSVSIISITLTGLGNFLVMKSGFSNIEGFYFFYFLSVTVVPMAVSMMFLLKRLTGPIINARITSRLALLSFGVYLIHPVFIDIFKFFGIRPENYNLFLSLPLIAAIVFILALAAAIVVNHIPVARKVIGF